MDTHSKIGRLLIYFLATVLLAGCPSTGSQLEYGYVQREWARNLRQLGIVPVFPPREDVFVGDVYAYAFDPNSVDTWRIFNTEWDKLTTEERSQRLTFGMNSRLARLDLVSTIGAEYGRTPAAAQTSPDYNGILGNAALAAANAALQEASGKVAELKRLLTNATEAVETAERTLLEASRQKEDTARAVTEAQTALDAAKAKPNDTSSLEQQLASLKQTQREAEDKVTTAQRAYDDAPAGPDKEAAERSLTLAKREKADIDLAVSRLTADIQQAKAIPRDTTAESTALLEAKTADELAAEAVRQATRARDDRKTALTKIQTEVAQKLVGAEAKVSEAKALRDAIAKAGERTLYAQPQYPRNNVYTGAALPDPKTDLNGQNNSRVNRFRLVGFPEFSSTSFTQGDLSALVPIDVLAVGLNISRSNVDKVVVKIPAAESYGVSFADFFPTLAEYDPTIGNWRLGVDLRELSVAAQFQTGINPADDSSYVYFRVISEVYYARAIDVSIFASNSFGFFLDANRLAAETEEEDYQTQAPTDGVAASRIPGSPETDKLVAQLQSNIGRQQSIPGGSIQLVSANAQSVGLRMVYDRPIAM